MAYDYPSSVSDRYPPYLTLIVGDLFSRLPKQFTFVKKGGSYPMYNRVIESIEQNSEHKLTVQLGEIQVPIKDSSLVPTDTATIFIYGEVEELLLDSISFESAMDGVKAL